MRIRTIGFCFCLGLVGCSALDLPESDPVVCGDGIVGLGEACDDGNTSNRDECTEDCKLASCGDGFVHVGVEACDDDNEADDDACRLDCTLAACGDGVRRTDLSEGDLDFEECDQGDGNTEDPDGACRSDCRLAGCGDGVLDDGEACDDGNSVETDACLNDCSTAACGDGLARTDLEVGAAGFEACDDGNEVNTDACIDCVAAACGDGFVRGDLNEGDPDYEACDDGNVVETDACTTVCAQAVCGDGHVQDGVEPCDDGNIEDSDACTNACSLAVCGDGITRTDLEAGAEGYEACDTGDVSETCDDDCSLPQCGDGFLNEPAGEACDEGDGNTEICDYGQQSCEVCSPACQEVAGVTNYCGDGALDEAEGEACDDGNDLALDGCSAACQAENLVTLSYDMTDPDRFGYRSAVQIDQAEGMSINTVFPIWNSGQANPSPQWYSNVNTPRTEDVDERGEGESYRLQGPGSCTNQIWWNVNGLAQEQNANTPFQLEMNLEAGRNNNEFAYAGFGQVVGTCWPSLHTGLYVHHNAGTNTHAVHFVVNGESACDVTQELSGIWGDQFEGARWHFMEIRFDTQNRPALWMDGAMICQPGIAVAGNFWDRPVMVGSHRTAIRGVESVALRGGPNPAQSASGSLRTKNLLIDLPVGVESVDMAGVRVHATGIVDGVTTSTSFSNGGNNWFDGPVITNGTTVIPLEGNSYQNITDFKAQLVLTRNNNAQLDPRITGFEVIYHAP